MFRHFFNTPYIGFPVSVTLTTSEAVFSLILAFQLKLQRSMVGQLLFLLTAQKSGHSRLEVVEAVYVD